MLSYFSTVPKYFSEADAICKACRGVSLEDSYWIKETNDQAAWADSSWESFFCFHYYTIGKSTLLSLIAGLIQPERGTIKINGKSFPKSTTNIGYMLQHDELFEWRTIYQNVLLGLEVQHMLSPKTRARAHELLKTYGLEAFEKSHPSELSGGMRQRAALIRTLVLEPDLLLLDEPFSALDYQTRLTVGDDIGQILRKEKKSAVLVTHDLSEAISLADRVIILTGRPATIHQTIRLRFDLEEDTPMNRRNAPEFKNYFNQIWKELNHND